MTQLRTFEFSAVDLDGLAERQGRIALLVNAEGRMSPGARRLNRLTKGALARLLEAERWEKTKAGEVISLAYPAGLSAELQITATALMIMWAKWLHTSFTRLKDFNQLTASVFALFFHQLSDHLLTRQCSINKQWLLFEVSNACAVVI